jgi:hypothetical protein
MGLWSPPYTIRMDMLGDEVMRGCPHIPFNPFFYDDVRLNLPAPIIYVNMLHVFVTFTYLPVY